MSVIRLELWALITMSLDSTPSQYPDIEQIYHCAIRLMLKAKLGSHTGPNCVTHLFDSVAVRTHQFRERKMSSCS